jgi:hypothetical protein
MRAAAILLVIGAVMRLDAVQPITQADRPPGTRNIGVGFAVPIPVASRTSSSCRSGRIDRLMYDA